MVSYMVMVQEPSVTPASGTSDATTSFQILTVNSSGIPVWTTTIDGALSDD